MDTAGEIWTSQYLTFLLAGEEYAVEILRTREITPPAPLTRVPSVPSFIRGVMNLRGSVIPVVDLAAKLRRGETAVTSATCIVIVELEANGEAARMGLLADAPGEVVSFARETIEEPPQWGSDRSLAHLRGMGRHEDKFILILDIDRALALAPGDGATQ